MLGVTEYFNCYFELKKNEGGIVDLLSVMKLKVVMRLLTA